MLQESARREFCPVAVGTLILTAAMVGVFALLHLFGVVTFGLPIVVSALLGALVACVNFYGLCLGAQKATATNDADRAKTVIQASYRYRMLFQTVWCIAAIVIPYLNPVAAIVPLLFPRLVILIRQARRSAAPAEVPKTSEDGPNESGD